MQNNLLTRLFAIPEIRRFVSFTQLEFFCQRKFWNRNEKLPRNVGAIFFEKTLKNPAYAQLRKIRRNQVISAHMRISTRPSKILGSVQQWKFIRVSCSERHFFLGSSLPKNFSATPAAIFALPIDIEKLIKAEGLILVKLSRASIQDQKGCCTFQRPLVYNRVCWGFVWCGYGLFSFEKWASRP